MRRATERPKGFHATESQVVGFPTERPRRLRQSRAVRALVAQTRLHPAELVLPVFILEGATEAQPITSMPGVVQHSLDSLVAVAHEALAAGLGGLMLFGVPTTRDATGSGADDPEGILNVGLRRLRDAVGDDLVIMSDLCLDEFTDHGHCGVLDDQGRVRSEERRVGKECAMECIYRWSP